LFSVFTLQRRLPTDNSTLPSNLANISFYSDSGNSFVGKGFEQGFYLGDGTVIIAVPEPETYFYALVLLTSIVVQYLRRRVNRKSFQNHHPEFATRAAAHQRDRLPGEGRRALRGRSLPVGPRAGGRRGPIYAARPPFHPEETPLHS